MALSALLFLFFAFAGSGSARTIDVSDKYVILLKPEAHLPTHLEDIRPLLTSQTESLFRGVIRQYNITAAFQVYAGHFSKSLIHLLSSHGDIELIEKDTIFRIAGLVKQQSATYGLGLLSHRHYPQWMDRFTYTYDSSAGVGTYAYVLDTGINTQHEDFGGRAILRFNAIPDDPFDDENGHGTHMAGTIGGRRFGVAKRCTLISVKILGPDGEGDLSSALDGFAWAVRDAVKRNRQARAVVNMSVVGPYSRIFNQAVEVAFANGVTTVTAAGNDDVNAVVLSPASSAAAITVGAADWQRERWEMSNWGSRVDLFAPGEDVKSAFIGSSHATEIMSGTSSSAAHVSGLVLYLKRLKNLDDAKMSRAYLLRLATKGVVGDTKGSRDLFAYNGVEGIEIKKT